MNPLAPGGGSLSGVSRFAAASAFAMMAPAAWPQEPPALSVPVACETGKTCLIQNYVDHGGGRDARDYRCGFLTYGGHRGIDVRVTDAARVRQGVPVLAAASGRVRAVRDGMPDVSVLMAGRESVAGREAGNSVVIEHGRGWQTQYAHLRRGSVSVRPGDAVERGQVLGLVGLSGDTEFPHLHFEVRYRRQPVDPFVGLEPGAPCALGRQPLWRPEALEAFAYVDTGLLDAGISGRLPAVIAGSVDRDRTGRFTAASPTVIFWVQIFGARADDLEEVRLLAPDGRVIAEQRGHIGRNLAQWLVYVGRPRANGKWLDGTYRGEYRLLRGAGGREILSLVREASIAGPEQAMAGMPPRP
jgi:hypothetical protein